MSIVLITEQQYDEGYRNCTCCGKITNNYLEGYSFDIVCERCQENGTVPVDGHFWYSYDSLYQWTDETWHKSPERIIQAYHESIIVKIPESKGDIYCGFELEVIPYNISRDKLAAELKQIGNIHCENDSSLYDGGFEIISNYGDLDSVIDLAKKVSNTLQGKAKSHETDCCGLHVHLTKGNSYDNAKLSVFWNDCINKEFIKNIARRYSQDYAYMDPEKNRDRYQKQEFDRLLHFEDKYGIMNIKSETVEIRAFRGTINPIRLLANIEMAWYSYEYCKQDITANKLTWKHFLNWLENQKSRYIFPYLDTRIGKFNWRELECV